MFPTVTEGDLRFLLSWEAQDIPLGIKFDLLWPGVLAILAIILFLHQAEPGRHPHHQIGQEEFSGELGIQHT